MSIEIMRIESDGTESAWSFDEDDNIGAIAEKDEKLKGVLKDIYKDFCQD